MARRAFCARRFVNFKTYSKSSKIGSIEMPHVLAIPEPQITVQTRAGESMSAICLRCSVPANKIQTEKRNSPKATPNLR